MSATKTFKRGEIWWVNFDPSVGSEIEKTRPAIILSNNLSNRALSRFQVVPLTTNVSKVYPSEAIVSVNGKPCKAIADQLTTVSEERLGNYFGTLAIADLKKVEKVVKLQLDLS